MLPATTVVTKIPAPTKKKKIKLGFVLFIIIYESVYNN